MRRPLVIKILAALVLLMAIAYAVVRLDNWMAIRSIDLPPPAPEANEPATAPAPEPGP